MPSSLIFFHRPGFNLENAVDLLMSHVLAIHPQGGKTVITWGDGPQLRLYFANGEDVEHEAEEIGIGTSYADNIKACDARFEIAFDDLDEVLDEINTLIEVQVTLQEATKGFLFNSWNGQLTPPDA